MWSDERTLVTKHIGATGKNTQTVFVEEATAGLLIPNLADSDHLSKGHIDDGADPRSDYKGYLVGFPRISVPDGRVEGYLHLWENNSDILGGTFAVPLLSLPTAIQVCFQVHCGMSAKRSYLDY